MRVSIVCIAIVCLSHVSGAPTDEEGKTFFKSYNFDKREVITAWTPLWKHEVVFAVCEGNDADKKCKVYVESTNKDKNTLQSCDLNLTYSGTYKYNVALYNVGNSKAVLAVGDGDDKIKLISVKFDGCEIKETSVEVVKETKKNPILPFVFIHIIPREKNFELLLRNSKLCEGGLCKVTYDYEGNVVKAASKLPAIFDSFRQIAYANNSYIIAKSQDDVATPTINIYLVKDGEGEENIPPIASIKIPHSVVLSADENKIGICWYEDGKLVCKQIHVEGEPRTINIEIPLNHHKSYYHALEVLNLEKGLLQLSGVVADGKNDYIINVTHFDEAGKQGKTVQVDPQCNEYYDMFTKLYKNTKGQYCVNSLCADFRHVSEKRSNVSITNRCFLKSELI